MEPHRGVGALICTKTEDELLLCKYSSDIATYLFRVIIVSW